MKRLFLIFVSLVLILSVFAGCSDVGDTTAPNTDGNGRSPVAGKKIAYIMYMDRSEIFDMWSASAEETAEALGMEYAEFFCGSDDDLWKHTVSFCAAAGYDGLLLSHGGSEYSYSFIKELLKEYPQLKITTFDTNFIDENGQTQTIDGVTQFFQQDAQLSRVLLDYICDELYPEKKQAGQAVNILKVWEGDYIIAFDRRQTGYAEYELKGLINTVETIAPTDHTNAEESVKAAAAEALARYEPGEIDAIWCCYDLYARGVYAALKEGGYDIPLVSVDICNADIEKMAEDSSPWKACATTNWNSNGEFGVRVLALEIAGEYGKIKDPSTGLQSLMIELPVTAVTAEMVASGDIDVSNLESVAGDGYSDRSYMPTSDWMDKLLDK